MEQLSRLEIAQERRKKRNRFILWIVLFILAAAVTLLSKTTLEFFCIIPILLGLGVLALMNGTELYFASPQRELSTQVLEQQMTWLFGGDWQRTASTQEIMLAQERIWRRQDKRRQFYTHLFISLAIDAALLSMIFSFPNPETIQVIGILLVSFTLLVVHGTKAFPSHRQLERRERDIGQAILTEIDRSIPEIAKRKEKPKRDVRYTIGEDGELEEVEEYSDNEKPKRDVL